jgi:hypothetical protein
MIQENSHVVHVIYNIYGAREAMLMANEHNPSSQLDGADCINVTLPYWQVYKHVRVL